MKTHITLYCSILLFGASSIFAGMDDARLKERLKGGLFELLVWDNYDIDKTGVSSEQFHRVLMELYDEAEEKRPSLTHGSEEWRFNQLTVEGVLACLSMCGDVPVKDFLLDYAITKENDNLTRTIALSSYLRVADAEEARNVLLRFLVGDERMASMERLSLYSFAQSIYDEASIEKKAAILAALFEAASREEGKIEFMKVDSILAKRSAAYRHSIERLAMLERHSEEPPTTNFYTDRDLKAALAESRSYTQHTSVSTNLMSLAAQNVNMPQPVHLSNGAAGASPDGPAAEPVTADTAGRGTGRRVLFVALALLLLGFGAWRFMRK